MGFALTSYRKDLARWRKDYMATIIWISIPLMIGGLITMLMGSDVKPHGLLLVVDEDRSLVSELVVSAYSAGELGDLISVEKTDYDAGLARVNNGDASGLLVIPEGFSRAFLDGVPVTLTLKTNPSQSILPGIITDVTEIVLDAGFYAHELFADEIAIINSMDSAPDDAQVAALSIAIRNKFVVAGSGLMPPLIDVEIVEPPPQGPSPSFALLFMPGIIMMAVLFAANGLAGDFWQERAKGTLRRLVFAPAGLGQFVVGKALAAATIIALVSGITLSLGFVYHGIDWVRLPLSLAWISLSGVALFAWFAALQMLFQNQRTANVISTTLLFPLLMAGGSFFPMAVMPGWMAAIGRVSPNGYVAERLTSVVTGGESWAIEPLNWVAVVAAMLAGLAVCSWRLRGGFARA